jgi:hypothetical protein
MQVHEPLDLETLRFSKERAQNDPGRQNRAAWMS